MHVELAQVVNTLHSIYECWRNLTSSKCVMSDKSQTSAPTKAYFCVLLKFLQAGVLSHFLNGQPFTNDCKFILYIRFQGCHLLYAICDRKCVCKFWVVYTICISYHFLSTFCNSNIFWVRRDIINTQGQSCTLETRWVPRYQTHSK